jgi:3-oxoacyl-[acyl-carrier protein] reductase
VTKRVAVISGGGTGIGAATAHALATQVDLLVLLGRRREPLDATAQTVRSQHDVEVETMSVDVGDPTEMTACADECVRMLGTIDIIVANAGSPQTGSDEDLSAIADAWRRTLQANLLTAVLLVEGLGGLLARPGGRIVMVGSAAVRTGNGSPGYAAAKAGLEAYAVSLMKRWGPEGITANIVAPGFTDGTELLTGRVDAQRRARLVSGISAGRPGSPDEIGHVIASLCAPQAGFVNGQTLYVDGGSIIPG